MRKSRKRNTIGRLCVLFGVIVCGMTACKNTKNEQKTSPTAWEEMQSDATEESILSELETESTKANETETETEAEMEIEAETESLYHADGSRRAWVQVEGRVNVREKASAKSDFIGSFPSRQEIKVLDEKERKGFYKVSGIDYTTGEEITGYASSAYISFEAPEAPRVELEVPTYLQTDERWADVLLGSTQKNMYDIGCATTALAMSESFLKEKTLYPDEVAEGAIYTSDGEIGWPKDYYWNYNKDMYLDFVYNKLHEGIPVLIGCTRTNGRPHWVLITGYIGDGTQLKAKDFLINDPLPYGRTNLQQYLEEYPVFSKLIYYCGDRAQVEGSEESKAAVQKAEKSKIKSSKSKN